RLYDAIGIGVLDISDPTLKTKLDELKLKRDRAKDVLDRIQGRSENQTELTDAVIIELGKELRKALHEGDLPFRKAWLKAMLSKITVGKTTITMEGSAECLGKLLEMTANSNGKNFSQSVRAYEPKWRTRKDSNL
ncbi:MAG: hypothetical protein H6888_15740, partial [Nitratireductor sp.]|nr:hypothetical protein [Nitratireductor sp.]